MVKAQEYIQEPSIVSILIKANESPIELTVNSTYTKPPVILDGENYKYKEIKRLPDNFFLS